MLNANRIKPLAYIIAMIWLTMNAAELSAKGGLQDRRKNQTQRGREGAEQNKPLPVSPKGKIKAIKAGLVKIGTEDDGFWLVKIPRGAEVRVLGTAELGFLRPGQFVRLKAKIDTRGMAQEKVAKLTIFTMSETSVLGFFPESGFSGGPDAAMEAEAGTSMKKTRTSKKKSVRSKSKKQKLRAAVYEVNGQVAGVKRNGQWTVGTPQGNLTFELAEDVEIAIDMADYSYAKPGDSISCAAFQNGEHMATARTVRIELAQPLAGMEKKGKMSRRSKTSKKRTSKADGDEDESERGESKSADSKRGKSKFGDKDKPSAEVTDKLAKLLVPKGEHDSGESLELKIKGKSVTFGPSTQGPAATLQKRFGRAKKGYARGAVTAADGTVGPAVQWKIWSWGPVKVAVDKRGKARFFIVEE
ncbi:MAG: hypothetical protein U9N87_04585 [Planctomycetota bacterium]|nr:hypothetical protein [Planctomycetota bacterium]